MMRGVDEAQTLFRRSCQAVMEAIAPGAYPHRESVALRHALRAALGIDGP
jgi:hypothetical protein